MKEEGKKEAGFSILDELQTTFANGFYLRSSKGYSGEYVAWCKREMFTGSDPIDESGDVWFEFGRTRVDAIANLWRSMESGAVNVGGPAFYDTRTRAVEAMAKTAERGRDFKGVRPIPKPKDKK